MDDIQHYHWLRAIHGYLFYHANFAIVIVLLFHVLLSRSSFVGLFAAAIFGSLAVYFITFRKLYGTVACLVNVTGNFLVLFALGHPKFALFDRIVLFFVYSEFSSLAVYHAKRAYADIILLIIFMTRRDLDATCYFSMIGLLCMLGFISRSFPPSILKYQRRIKLKIPIIMVSAIFQLILKQKICFQSILIALISLIPNRVGSFPKFSFSAGTLLCLCISLLITCGELWFAWRHHSGVLMSLGMKYLFFTIYDFSVNIKCRACSDPRYSYGLAKLPAVSSFVLVMLGFSITIWIFTDSVKRLILVPFVEERHLFAGSWMFIFCDILQLVLMITRNSEITEKMTNSLYIFLIGSVGAVISSVSIYLFDIYVFDPLVEIIVGLSMLGIIIDLLLDSTNSLMAAVGDSCDIEAIKNTVRKLGTLTDCRIWELGRNSHIATFRVSAAEFTPIHVSEALDGMNVTATTELFV